MTDDSNFDVELDGDVFRIAFDQPEHRNAVNPSMDEKLTDVFREASESEARVVVLTGNGDTFSAGGDVTYMEECVENPQQFEDAVLQGDRILRSLVDVDQPTVARINGDAIGLGATLALFCDVSIATEDARIGDPHVDIGLVTGDGGAVIWPLLVGLNQAKEFLMTGDLLTGKEAADIGLVNRAVPPEELDDEVEEVVDTFARKPQRALQLTKTALNQWLEFGLDLTIQESLAFEAISQRHEDHAEAVDAFIQGRQPDFPSARDADRE